MKQTKITNDYAHSCIKKFKTILNSKKRANYCFEKNHGEPIESVYDLAKQEETKTRNLHKALGLYVKAGLNGEKLNSCIKDFASVLHQSGFTYDAISFLEDMKHVYKGDKLKYQKLINNLSAQLKPTGKHEYKNILIDLVNVRLHDPVNQVKQMFANWSRIKAIQFYDGLGFQVLLQNSRYVVLQFDSFSAAKKTLETFKQDQWFGVDKYWMDHQLNIIAEANDGKTDFQNRFVFHKGRIHKFNGKQFPFADLSLQIPNFEQIFGYEGLQLRNQVCIYLIKNFDDLMI